MSDIETEADVTDRKWAGTANSPWGKYLMETRTPRKLVTIVNIHESEARLGEERKALSRSSQVEERTRTVPRARHTLVSLATKVAEM